MIQQYFLVDRSFRSIIMTVTSLKARWDFNGKYTMYDHYVFLELEKKAKLNNPKKFKHQKDIMDWAVKQKLELIGEI